MFGGVYSGCRVLVTGHTGFKGSWLALWLQRLGAQVAGLALPPPGSPSHWELLGLDIDARTMDIRDAAAVHAAVAHFRPQAVFHLAAQALVRPSYEDPLATWSTNVMGTAHVLEACRQVPGVRAIVVATSDKCYANREWHWAYRESDPLGGHDPYSARATRWAGTIPTARPRRARKWSLRATGKASSRLPAAHCLPARVPAT
jgi:CDP-glucose 4,6-dehydratase